MSDQGEPARSGAPGGDLRPAEPVESATGPMPQVDASQLHDTSLDAAARAGASAFDSAFEPVAGGAAHSKSALGGGDSAFDGVESGEGDSNYAGVDLSGPSGPVKAGVPSSGNWQMPEWMREEAGEGPGGGFNLPEGESGGGRGKVILFSVIGLIVVAALAAAAMLFLRGGKGADKSKVQQTPVGSAKQPSSGDPATGGKSSAPQAAGLPDTPLQKFPGIHTKAAGRVDDAFSGLSYPRFSSPWQVPTKKSGLMQLGWSGQQIVVTEKHGDQLWYGQLMSGVLGPTEQDMYQGPGSEHAAAVAYEQGIEARMYGFPHDSKPIASQPLDLPGSGGKGWLVASNLSYHRDGIRATGEIVTVAIVNTGKKSPAVLFMSVPNTEKKLMPDINFVVDSLKLTS